MAVFQRPKSQGGRVDLEQIRKVDRANIITRSYCTKAKRRNVVTNSNTNWNPEQSTENEVSCDLS